jgi:hypothetical protein
MKIALKKYETRKLEKSWNKRSHKEQEIVALKAQLNKLSMSKKSTTAAPPGNTPSPTPTDSSKVVAKANWY